MLRLPGWPRAFAAAEGAIGLALNANKARKKPLRVILNGLGKDAAQIIARINGFTYVKTQFDYFTGELKVVETIPYSDVPRRRQLLRRRRRPRGRCHHVARERRHLDHRQLHQPDALPAPPSLAPTRRSASRLVRSTSPSLLGGGTGRTLHPDNMGAGPASYGMTDTMGRMHSDAQFAGSSSVPAHVDMMGLIGMGNNPMVGATVACAVAVEEALKA